MKRKLLVSSALAVGAVLASASFSASEAAIFRGRLAFDQDSAEPQGDFIENVSSSGIDFVGGATSEVDSSSTEDFATLIGNTVFLNDLVLDGAGNLLGGPQVLFSVDSGPSFTATSVSNVLFSPVGPNDLFAADLRGFFTSGPNNTAVSPSSVVIALNGGGNPVQSDFLNYSFTTVPTPALLPGLIGMGVAALRRRKEEELESAES
ncbi:PTPA-CTERM sorting domain-containing protein [cf. Phormidesmis sp. LEGE 11477]|uniref:PTPA-CTERM sorting domain-containing protein n=1 Tax=cf. Phormidesmis sp. LEGE 11477 TaxID=1828680 RepID=UPI00187ECF87|nr:PTPA-CTERM sorting domain-containing protein [cf. Phormidesmis sp. LEGE 11477]MBE9061245.1 PTPA-CTERM sorting domain-containing protein [cf. Phormidesmis sp. LEGE 11477]